MVWDAETIRLLKDLWAEGHSTAEIGRRLGVSKNAIVGKAHRLDLDARPSPIRRDAVRPADRPAPYPRMAGPTLPPLASAHLQPTHVPPPSNVQPLRQMSALAPRPLPPAPVAPPVVRPAVAAPQHTRRSAPSCCWPIGDPGTKSFRFCDDVSLPGKPYATNMPSLPTSKFATARRTPPSFGPWDGMTGAAITISRVTGSQQGSLDVGPSLRPARTLGMAFRRAVARL